MRHEDKHPLAGQEVELIDEFDHRQYPDMDSFVIEDWWDHLTGGSWMNANGNPAAMVYGIRTGVASYNVPIDDEVIYGHYKNMGVLVHKSEIKNYEALLNDTSTRASSST